MVDSTACLFISGQAKRADLKGDSGLRQLGPQEVDICALVKPITKYAATVQEPARIREHLDTALNLARSGRPGPVWLDIPLDVQAAQIDPDRLAGAGDTWRVLDDGLANLAAPDAVAARAREVAAMIRMARRPVLLVGNGVRVSGAVDQFQDLVRRLGIPVLTTRLGIDLLPAEDQSRFGIPGTLASRAANFTLQNSDLLVAIGTRLDLGLIAHNPAGLAPRARRVMVNIDAAELRRMSAVMDLTICSDAGVFLRALDIAIGNEPLEVAEWLDRCDRWRARYPFVNTASTAAADAAGEISVYRFAEIVADEMDPGDVLLPGSSGAACEIFLTAYSAKKGQRVFHNKGTGAMGLGIPAAIGARLAAGQRRLVCVDGDGGFQFNIQELETVRRLALPITFFVISNGGYASIRQSQSHHFGRQTGADSSSGLTLPDVLRVAAAYGIPTTRLVDPTTARADVRRVLDAAGPVVCEVVAAQDEERMPRVQSQVLPDGSVVSKPLEDMWPFLDRSEFEANMRESEANLG